MKKTSKMLYAFLAATILVAFTGCVTTDVENDVSSAGSDTAETAKTAPTVFAPGSSTLVLISEGGSTLTLSYFEGNKSGTYKMVLVDDDKNLKAGNLPPLPDSEIVGKFSLSGKNLTITYDQSDYGGKSEMGSDTQITLKIWKGASGELGYSKITFNVPEGEK